MILFVARAFISLTRGMAVLGALAAVVLMAGISADVARRYFVGSSILGMLEVSETLMVLMVFLGMSYAEHTRTHVRMTLLTNRLPPRISATLRLVAFLVSTWVIGWMAWQTSMRARSSIEMGEFGMGVLQLPLWPARAAIAIGLLAATVQLIMRVVDQVYMIVRGTPSVLTQNEERMEIIGL
jgi:TRAP-type C4-dicarboxylate transport system permease small subunit